MSACIVRATDLSLCKRRLHAALGECSSAELDACCLAAAVANPSSSPPFSAAAAASDDDAATDRVVRSVLRARGTQQFAVAATRGRRVGAPEPACPTVFRCNTWVGPALYLSSAPTLALRPHDAAAAGGGPPAERWMLHPTGATDVHTCTVQSCTTRLMLCVREGAVQACAEAEHPHEQYEFVFVESHSSGLWLLLPKALKGAAVRGSSDGSLSLYRFRSGRTACTWEEGLGGAVDDRLCPNTAEWALDAGSVELEGLTVEPPTGTLPADLTAGEAEASVVFESVRHRGVCLSAVRRERASTTKLAPSTLELFQLRREPAGRWRVLCPSVPEFALVVRLVACRYRGEPCFLLCTAELQYLTVGPGASVLRLASYEAASLWRARLHKLENHEAAAAAYRRVAGTFPNRSTRAASAAAATAVRRSSDVRRRAPREDEAAVATAAAAAVEEKVAVEEVARLKACLASLAARAAAREAAAVAAATACREKGAGREEAEVEEEAVAAAAAAVAVPTAVAAAAEAAAAAVAAAVCVGAAAAAAAPDAVVSAWEGRVRCLLERMGQREASLRAAGVGADAAPLPAWWQSRRCM